MDEKKIEEELKKLWDETPISHTDSEKEASWEVFQSKTFADKKKKPKAWIYYAAAAAVLIFASVGTGIYFNKSQFQDQIYASSNVVENLTSEIKTVFLPDSSKVELSPNSKIEYADNFTVNRKIEVTGEAFFKVTKDKKHPFQVFCNETTTTVLGTCFTVKGFEKKGVIVALYEGVVQMNVKGQDKKWTLIPGEKFMYGDHTLQIDKFERFVDFDNQNLTALCNYIEANYGYKVVMPQEYRNKRITVRVNRKEDLKTIAQLISEMYNLNFKINDEVKQITFQ